MNKMNRTIIDGIDCILLYHGTSISNHIDVMDTPTMKQCINGLGFYLTDDVQSARRYGSKVIAFAMRKEVYEQIKFVVRSIDLSFTDGIRRYGDCKQAGMEWVITTQGGCNTLAVECEDTYLVHLNTGEQS